MLMTQSDTSIAESLLAEFETQALVTRRFLERLPEDKLGWKPHPKSMSAGQLAYHLARVPAESCALLKTIPRRLRNPSFFRNPPASKNS